MMTLSASTWLMSNIPGTKNRYTIEQCLDAMRAAGFTYADANLWSLGGHDRPLSFDNWREWAEQTRAYADSIGIAFRQTHGQTLSGQRGTTPIMLTPNMSGLPITAVLKPPKSSAPTGWLCIPPIFPMTRSTAG